MDTSKIEQGGCRQGNDPMSLRGWEDLMKTGHLRQGLRKARTVVGTEKKGQRLWSEGR